MARAVRVIPASCMGSWESADGKKLNSRGRADDDVRRSHDLGWELAMDGQAKPRRDSTMQALKLRTFDRTTDNDEPFPTAARRWSLDAAVP